MYFFNEIALNSALCYKYQARTVFFFLNEIALGYKHWYCTLSGAYSAVSVVDGVVLLILVTVCHVKHGRFSLQLLCVVLWKLSNFYREMCLSVLQVLAT